MTTEEKEELMKNCFAIVNNRIDAFYKDFDRLKKELRICHFIINLTLGILIGLILAICL